MPRLMAYDGAALLLLWFSVCAFAQTEPGKPQGEFADLRGVSIHYESMGKGSGAIVFVHGWACSAEFWKRTIAAFPRYRVIALDLPGHGRSDKPRTRYTLDYFAGGIDAVMNHAGVDRAVLVGHSLGASIVRRFQRLHPERTLGLVFVDGLPWIEANRHFRDGKTQRDTEEILVPYRTRYAETVSRDIEQMVAPIRDRQLQEETRSTMRATPAHVGMSAIEGQIEGALDEWGGGSQTIDVPILVVLAESGPWKPEAEAVIRAKALRVNFQKWPGVSHFLMMEQPSRFNEALGLFISMNSLLGES